jgi:DnaJ-domain-containing protein 1
MNNAWYADDSAYSTADLLCGGKPAETLFGGASASCLASQIRELLGEDCELDASFLEESWASGLPATAARYRRRRDQAAKDDDVVTFGELNTVGSFFFSQAGGLVGDRPAYICPADSTKSYTAAWLHDPLGDLPSRTQDQAPAQGSAGCTGHSDETGTLGSMTYQRACELLSVREQSTGTQIRAAYRRMVGEWHPDRLEQSGEPVRAFATKQMAAINEAYHLLRDFSVVPAC